MSLQYSLEDPLATPRTFTTMDEFENFPDDNLPAVIAVSGGVGEMPEQAGTGIYEATWRLGIGIVAKGPTKLITNRNIKIYAATIRAIMLQQRSLGGVTSGMYWLGEDYTDRPSDQARTLGTAVVLFNVVVPAVVNAADGPLAPPSDGQPGSEWPEVEEIDLVVTEMEVP